MQPLDDYPIDEDRVPPDVPEPASPSTSWWSIGAMCLVGGIAVGTALFFLRRAPADVVPASSETTVAVEQQAEARRPLGAQVQPSELPPLDLTDPLVRSLLRGLSSRPELASWLATDGLIRNFAASVDNVANGITPAAHLRRLAPARAFAAETYGQDFVIAPGSYARYDGLADTVASLDGNALARVYATLRPRLQEAYRELGYPEGDFDVTVERAIVRLLQTPAIDGPAAVRPSPVRYKFIDVRLESLSPAQKQLLRMGPRNVRMIQSKLREVALALGIPAGRLPAAP